MTKKIIGIWAEDKQHVIGYKGELPWHLPRDLAHFKQATTNEAILMGRKTFDGMKRRILPKRQTLILTRDENYSCEDVLVFHSRAEVLAWYEQQEKSLFIIGGAEIFKLFANDLTELSQTVIDGELEGDTYFPADFPFTEFEKVQEEYFAADEKNAYNMTINSYLRKP